MGKIIEEYVQEYAKETPDKIAVIVNGEQISYGRLFELACGYAAYLKQKGIKKGDVVVAKSSQSLEYILIYLGVHLAGGIIAGLEKSIPNEGIISAVNAIGGAKAIISDDASILEKYDTIFLDNQKVLEHAQMYHLDEIQFPAEDDSADILYTTGTTGASKGVEISHKALIASAENTIYGCKYKKDTVIIVPGPLNHASAVRKLFTTFVNGSTIYVLDGMTNLKEFFIQ